MLVYNGTTFTNNGFVPTWTQGSFNSATFSGTWQQNDTLMMSSWAMGNGTVAVHLSAAGPTQFPTSGLSSNDHLVFGTFVETEDSTYYYATSYSFEQNPY